MYTYRFLHCLYHPLFLILYILTVFALLCQFVAHAKCQQVVQGMWSSGLPEWVRHQPHIYIKRFLYLLLFLIIMPASLLTYIIPLCPNLDRWVAKPYGSEDICDNVIIQFE